jgi:hypothetical protein
MMLAHGGMLRQSTLMTLAHGGLFMGIALELLPSRQALLALGLFLKGCLVYPCKHSVEVVVVELGMRTLKR